MSDKLLRVRNTFIQAFLAGVTVGFAAVHGDFSRKALYSAVTAAGAAAFSYLQHTLPGLLKSFWGHDGSAS